MAESDEWATVETVDENLYSEDEKPFPNSSGSDTKDNFYHNC